MLGIHLRKEDGLLLYAGLAALAATLCLMILLEVPIQLSKVVPFAGIAVVGWYVRVVARA